MSRSSRQYCDLHQPVRSPSSSACCSGKKLRSTSSAWRKSPLDSARCRASVTPPELFGVGSGDVPSCRSRESLCMSCTGFLGLSGALPVLTCWGCRAHEEMTDDMVLPTEVSVGKH